MKSGRLYLCKLLFRLFPETRMFGMKVCLLQWAGVLIGRNVRLCSSINILGTGSLEIGDDTWVGHEVLIISSSAVKIGSFVDIGPRAFIGTGSHKIDAEGIHSAGEGFNRDVIIGDGVWLGACSVISPGVSIGQKSVVAAGAVVIREVAERKIVGGVPARILKDVGQGDRETS